MATGGRSEAISSLKYDQIMELVEMLEKRLEWSETLDPRTYWNRLFAGIQIKDEDGRVLPKESLRACLQKLWYLTSKGWKKNRNMLLSTCSLERMVPLIEEFLSSDVALSIFFPNFPPIPATGPYQYFVESKLREEGKKKKTDKFVIGSGRLQKEWANLNLEKKIEWNEKFKQAKEDFVEERDKFLQENHQLLPNMEKLQENARLRDYQFVCTHDLTKVLENLQSRQKLKADIVENKAKNLTGFKLFYQRNAEKYSQKYQLSGPQLEIKVRKKYEKLPLVKRLALDNEIHKMNAQLKRRIARENTPYRFRPKKTRPFWVNPVTKEPTRGHQRWKGKMRWTREGQKWLKELKEMEEAERIEEERQGRGQGSVGDGEDNVEEDQAQDNKIVTVSDVINQVIIS